MVTELFHCRGELCQERGVEVSGGMLTWLRSWGLTKGKKSDAEIRDMLLLALQRPLSALGEIAASAWDSKEG